MFLHDRRRTEEAWISAIAEHVVTLQLPCRDLPVRAPCPLDSDTDLQISGYVSHAAGSDLRRRTAVPIVIVAAYLVYWLARKLMT